jgi:hypothetical protein
MEIFYSKSKNGELIFDNNKALSDYLKTVDGKSLVVRIERETGVRSDNQNRALHLYFEHLAKELNDAGYNIQKLLSHAVDLDWDKDTVKELLWRPIQVALINKKSTTNLDRVSEIDVIWEHLNRYLGELGIHVPFPSEINKNI